MALARRYGIESMYVFGSRAAEIAERTCGTEMRHGTKRSQTANSQSDVDIGVQPRRDTELRAKERVALTLELEDLLGVSHVDLVVLPEANAALAAEVVRGELLYAENPDAEAETQLYYLRRAGDLAPFYREQWRKLGGVSCDTGQDAGYDGPSEECSKLDSQAGQLLAEGGRTIASVGGFKLLTHCPGRFDFRPPGRLQ